MEKLDVFLIIAILILIFFYLFNFYEHFGSSFDITAAITTAMDYKGSQLSTIPTYPNNLQPINNETLIHIKDLQKYNSNDGETITNYVQLKSDNTNDVNKNIYEGFSIMNPYLDE